MLIVISGSDGELPPQIMMPAKAPMLLIFLQPPDPPLHYEEVFRTADRQRFFRSL